MNIQNPEILTDEFMSKQDCPPLLDEYDPAPITMHKGESALIFTGPHNGKIIPECLPSSLGMEDEWFQNAHEASDLYMAELFEQMQDRFTQASFLAGNYSRLVCDLNRQPDYSVTLQSSEHDHMLIPENQPECCCQQEQLRRITALHNPYHDAKFELVSEVRKKHAGVIMLDMHSFTPTWQGTPREVEIGTIRAEKTPLSRALESYLKEQDQYKFISGEPYRVAERPESAANMVKDRNDLQYLGIEIRSDLIDTAEKREKICAFLQDCVRHLENHPDINNIIAKRSGAVETSTSAETTITTDTWSI